MAGSGRKRPAQVRAAYPLLQMKHRMFQNSSVCGWGLWCARRALGAVGTQGALDRRLQGGECSVLTVSKTKKICLC
jgi:hypothetical protein